MKLFCCLKRSRLQHLAWELDMNKTELVSKYDFRDKYDFRMLNIQQVESFMYFKRGTVGQNKPIVSCCLLLAVACLWAWSDPFPFSSWSPSEVEDINAVQERTKIICHNQHATDFHDYFIRWLYFTYPPLAKKALLHLLTRGSLV